MAEVFKKLFGCTPAEIGHTVIMLPSNDRALFREIAPENFPRGFLFDVCGGPGISLVTLKNRSLAGDCVMHLKNTACRRVILFGSCGGLSLDISEKALVSEALNLESFTSFLHGTSIEKAEACLPEGVLTGDLKKYGGEKLRSVRCATVSSLYLEEAEKEKLKKNGIDCIDMEASMVLSAASFCGIQSAVLFYCTDSPGRINYYDDFPAGIREKIKGSRRSLALILIKFLKSEQAGTD